MSERKGSNKLQRAWNKLQCTSGSAVAVIDEAHKAKDIYNQSQQEYSKGTKSKQKSPLELPKPCVPPQTLAPNPIQTSYFYSEGHPNYQRSVDDERNQDGGHRYATSPAGLNSHRPEGWPCGKFPPQPQKSPSHQRNLDPAFQEEQHAHAWQPEPRLGDRAMESQGHAELGSGIHNGSQRLTPVESQNSTQGHPGGSYADDGTGPSPKILLTAFAGVKEALNNFTKNYIASMKGDMAEWQVLEEAIKKEVTVKTSRANHWKFIVQAYISSRLFEGFDEPDYELDGIQDHTNVECFQQFRDYNDKVETISRLLSTDIPADSFLSKFCFQKFKRVIENPLTEGPFLSRNQVWKDIEDGQHPNTNFYCSFLKVAISVWLLHRLRFSFEQRTSSIIFHKGEDFNTMCMESVVPHCEGDGEEEDDDDKKGGKDNQNLIVGFMVIPGLQVSEAVVKSEVYLVRVELNEAANDAGKRSIMDEELSEDSGHAHELDKATLDAGNRSIVIGESSEDSSDGQTDYVSLVSDQEHTPSSALQQNNRSFNEQISPAKLIERRSKNISQAKKGHQKGSVEWRPYMEPTISSKMKTSPTVHK